MISFAKLFLLALIGCVASDCSSGTCADSDDDNGGVNLLQKEMRLASANQVEAGFDSVKPTMIPLQNFHATTFDRYPTIFRRLKDLLPSGNLGPARKPVKLLSFGCSYGSEVRTLRRDFPYADIDGVDIATEVIKGNIKENKDKRVHYYDNVAKLESASYDAVLVMGVLCNENSTSTHLAHADFVGALDAVDKLVRPGGLLVVYNADYPFSEYPRFLRYVNKCGQLVTPENPALQSVSAADVKYDRPHDASLHSDPARGMCSTIDRSCIESGWGNKFSAAGVKIQHYGHNVQEGREKETKMSPGCNFPGVFYEKLNQNLWPPLPEVPWSEMPTPAPPPAAKKPKKEKKEAKGQKGKDQKKDDAKKAKETKKETKENKDKEGKEEKKDDANKEKKEKKETKEQNRKEEKEDTKDE